MRFFTKSAAEPTPVQLARLVVLLCFIAIAPRVASAPPAGEDWIGKRVVQKFSDFELAIDNEVINPLVIETYHVEQVDGARLRLQAPQLNRWALADEMIPVEKAIDFFT